MNGLATREIGRPSAASTKVLVGLGGNLATAAGGPRQTIEAALQMMPAFGIRVCERAPLYRTPALSTYVQQKYVNTVVEIESALPPATLLGLLHRIEVLFERVRRDRWGPRTLDLDLLDYRGMVIPAVGPRGPEAGVGPLPLALPHPGLAERAFALLPLRDIVPGWRHPMTGESVETLIGRLPAGALREVERLGS
ncbi:MAG: 2-amino-4-hydroxy-6-hydroxymethyldihydropteridine diphosphokinase [Parvibaculum sp.]|uniref:2-amino-4-hydroxy-6- hydroxymethyldihydropteridine diphosphokinase n=1 Tax=Parvibaculum sp. TaxID=2024848 RepID=UPI0034A00F7A